VLHASARQLAPLVIVGAGLIWATAAQAQYVVSNNNDSGPGSLRQAIMDADNAGAPNGVPNGTTSRAPTAERPSCAISGECLVQATQFADFGGSPAGLSKAGRDHSFASKRIGLIDAGGFC